MPRLRYDSVNPFAIPEHAQMVLGYVDGIFKRSQAGRDRFRHAEQVTCSAIGAVSAHVGDVEEGRTWLPANAVPSTSLSVEETVEAVRGGAGVS